MPRFFIDDTSNDKIIISDENARHIAKSLRMTVGEKLTLCSGDGYDCNCVINEITADCVYVTVESRAPSYTEPNVSVTLYQCMPKGDKMELIIQKCVELGAAQIIPVMSARCISRPDNKAMAKKLMRWNKISLEAAQQSERGIIPKVGDTVNFDAALQLMKQHDLAILFYEKGGLPLNELINAAMSSNNDKLSIGIMVGPEGGFEPSEVDKATQNGINITTLGSRILRTETAGMTAAAIIMYATGNMQ